MLTCRPDFTPPWIGRSHYTQVTLALAAPQVAETSPAGWPRKALPAEVSAQIVAKADGVPLFVEELTRMVLESGLLQEQDDHYVLTGALPAPAIPTTLHDSLLARLDHLGGEAGLAQLGATLGRDFSTSCCGPCPRGATRRSSRGCVSWWQRSCSTSVDCHRPPTSSSTR